MSTAPDKLRKPNLRASTGQPSIDTNRLSFAIPQLQHAGDVRIETVVVDDKLFGADNQGPLPYVRALAV